MNYDRSFISKMAKEISQPVMSEIFGISKSTVYKLRVRKDKINLKKMLLMVKIVIIFKESRMTYGATKIKKALSEEGIVTSVKTVRKIMNQLNIKPEFSKKIKERITKNNWTDLYNKIRYIKVEHLNQIWTEDITEIKLVIGKCYLATVMDLYSRKIISYEISEKMDTNLICKVLKKAIILREPKPGIFIHSDKGSQYRSKKYIKIVESIGGIRSYTRPKFSCADNAVQESFHASLKKEDIYLKPVLDIDEAKKRIKDYIEKFYNKTRLHTSIGNMSPDKFEEEHKDKTYSNDINFATINRVDIEATESEKEKMYAILSDLGYRENEKYEDLNIAIANYKRDKLSQYDKITFTQNGATVNIDKNPRYKNALKKSRFYMNSQVSNSEYYILKSELIPNELKKYDLNNLTKYDTKNLKIILQKIEQINIQ